MANEEVEEGPASSNADKLAAAVFAALETAERCRRQPSMDLFVQARTLTSLAIAALDAIALAEPHGAFRRSYLHMVCKLSQAFAAAELAVGTDARKLANDAALRLLSIEPGEKLPAVTHTEPDFKDELEQWAASDTSSFWGCVFEDLVLDDGAADQFFVPASSSDSNPPRHDTGVQTKRNEKYQTKPHVDHPGTQPTKLEERQKQQNRTSNTLSGAVDDNGHSPEPEAEQHPGHWRPGMKRGRAKATPIGEDHASDHEVEPETQSNDQNPFTSARERLAANQAKRGTNIKRKDKAADEGLVRKVNQAVLRNQRRGQRPDPGPETSKATKDNDEKELPEIPNVEPRLIELILNEALEESPGVEWSDIAGLEFAKRCVMEAVIWPMQRPDIFRGLRGPPKGLLLFGPPGTGKTMIGRAIASKSGATFFNISASSLTSKWIGEGEKTVRALFAVARLYQPSVIFIDEIDSLLAQRTESDQEASRRLKTEFLVQMDGAGTCKNDRILVVGATNRPQELDEAARRRLVKRLYIPLPDRAARKGLVQRLLSEQAHSLTEEDFEAATEVAAGYSGSDIYSLCGEAALGPVRDLGDKLESVEVDAVRPISMEDLKTAARLVRASVCEQDLSGYLAWNETYGSFASSE